MKGQVPNCRNRGTRNGNDFYETPYSMTRQFLGRESFTYQPFASMLEPACGKGAIVKVLEEFNCRNITAYDINHNGKDFLKEEGKFDYMITNPPFSLHIDFIEKAKEIIHQKFALLLPLDCLHGQERYFKQIFTDNFYPCTRIYAFTRKPNLKEAVITHDGRYPTGMMAYAWYVWERCSLKPEAGPIIHWLDNSRYCIKGVKDQ